MYSYSSLNVNTGTDLNWTINVEFILDLKIEHQIRHENFERQA